MLACIPVRVNGHASICKSMGAATLQTLMGATSPASRWVLHPCTRYWVSHRRQASGRCVHHCASSMKRPKAVSHHCDPLSGATTAPRLPATELECSGAKTMRKQGTRQVHSLVLHPFSDVTLMPCPAVTQSTASNVKNTCSTDAQLFGFRPL